MKRLLILLFIFGYFSTAKAQWNYINSGTTYEITDIQFIDSTHGYFCGPGQFFKTTDGGNTWSQINFSGNDSLYYSGCLFYSVFFLNPDTGFLAGLSGWDNKGIIIKTTDGGITWNTVDLNTATVFNAICFVNNTKGYVVGNGGVIKTSSDCGESWFTMNSGTTIDLLDIDYYSTYALRAVENNGICYTSDGGSHWYFYPYSEVFHAIKLSKYPESFLGYIAAEDGKIFKLTSFPYEISTHTNYIFKDIFFTSPDTIYAVSDEGYVLRSCNQGIYWEKQHFIENFRTTFFSTKETGFIGGYNGVLLKTNNEGGTYAPVAGFHTDPQYLFCPDSIINFLNYGDTNWTYQWFVDDSLISTDYNTSYVFTEGEHTYPVKLVAYNGTYYDTCIKYLHTTYSLNTDLEVTPLVDTICPGDIVYIYVLHSDYNATYQLKRGNTNIGSYQDGNGDTLVFTATTYSPTTYTMVARKSNNCGYKETTQDINIIPYSPEKGLNVYAGQNQICEGDTAIIFIDSTQTDTYYQLYDGNNFIYDSIQGTGSTINFIIDSIPNTTTYSIYATNVYGCTSILDSTPTVEIIHPIADFNPIPQYSFPGDTISLQNLSNTDTYVWQFDSTCNITTDTSAQPHIYYNTTGEKTITLIGNTAIGCSDTISKKVIIFSHPSGSDTGTYCFFDTINQLSHNFICLGKTFAFKVDREGNSYLGGYTHTNYGINGKELMFVKKFDKNGNLVWSITQNPYDYPGNGWDSYISSFVTGLAVDNDLNVYITGSYTCSPFRIGNCTVSNSGLYPQFFIAKLDSNGVCQWIIHSNKTSSLDVVGGTDILWIPETNHIVVSLIKPEMGYFPGNNQTWLGDDISILEIDNSGNFINVYAIDDVSGFDEGSINAVCDFFSNQRAPTITPKIKALGNKIYVVGEYLVSYFDSLQSKQKNICPQYAAIIDLNNGVQNVFLLYKISIPYDRVDMRKFPVFNIDENGNLYISAYCGIISSSNDTVIAEVGNGDIIKGDYGFIEKYDSSGNMLWYRKMMSYFIKGIEPMGNQIITYGNYTDFLGINYDDSIYYGVRSLGDVDLGIISLDTNGNVNWIDNMGSSSTDDALFTTSNTCGDIYFTGTFADTGITPYDTLIYAGSGVESWENHIFLLHFSPSSNCVYNCPSVITSDNGKHEVSDNKKIEIYPNPAKDFLVINNAKGYQASLYDNKGIMLKKTSINNNQFIINMKKYPVGVYFLQLTNNTDNENFKFIKTR